MMNGEKGDKLINNHWYLSILLCLFSYPMIAQTNSIELDFISLANIDSNIIRILDWHKNTTEIEGSFCFTSDCIYVIEILPRFNTSDGIPKHIIDSLYMENCFPPTMNSPGYSILVLSYNRNDPEMLGTLDRQTRLFSTYNSRDVIIISNLDLMVPLTNEVKSIMITGNNNFTSQPMVYTNYRYYFFEVFEIKLLKLFRL